jgi:hypothetical protein
MVKLIQTILMLYRAIIANHMVGRGHNPHFKSNLYFLLDNHCSHFWQRNNDLQQRHLRSLDLEAPIVTKRQNTIGQIFLDSIVSLDDFSGLFEGHSINIVCSTTVRGLCLTI